MVLTRAARNVRRVGTVTGSDGGSTRDELIGAPFKSYFTDPERAEAGIKLVLSEKKVTDYELTARALDGKKTVVSYNATTFYDRGRRPHGSSAWASASRSAWRWRWPGVRGRSGRAGGRGGA